MWELIDPLASLFDHSTILGMDQFKRLIRTAQVKRDKAISKARSDYRLAVREIRSLERKLTGKPSQYTHRAFRKPFECRDHSCRLMTVIGAAELILSEGTPMTAIELTIEIQRRGCRYDDDPEAILHSLRSSFRYHKDRFQRDDQGRWAIVG